MYPKLKEEFAWRCFSLRFHKVEAFCEVQWRWPRLVFVLYRLLTSAYSIFAFTHMAVTLDNPGNRHHFMVFLTNWTYLVETLFFFWGAVLAVCFFFWPFHFKGRSTILQGLPMRGRDVESRGEVGKENAAYDGHKAPGNSVSGGTASKGRAQSPSLAAGDAGDGAELDADVSLPWYVQVYWVLGNIIQDMALVVTVVYFGALYSSSEGITFLDLNVHGLNTLMIVLDVMVCARPVRLLHVLYPIVYGVLYVIFSVIYWSQDHENNVLYPKVLDWNYPGSTCGVVAGLAVVGIPLLQLAHYGIYQLRLCCHHRLYGERYL